MERKPYLVAAAVAIVGWSCGWCAEPARADAAGPAGAERVVLRVVGPQGQAVAGAKVGTGLNVFENSQGHPPQTIVMWLRGQRRQWPFVSDADGCVILTGEQASYRQFYALYEARGWAGYAAPAKTPATGEVKLRLEPACRVHGWLSSREFDTLGLALLETTTFVHDADGRLIMYFVSERGRCEFLLPAGQYRLEIEGRGPNGARTQRLERKFDVAAGEREIDLDMIDLPATKLASLCGKPAPELQGIAAWVQGEPVSLESARGRPVVLTFWGSWCGPAIRAVPRLMELYDEFEPFGVVFVAIHDTTIETAEVLTKKLADISAASWQDKELPFAVGLDAGEKSGATHAAYGIRQWPTTLLIGRDGKLVGQFSPWSELRTQLRQTLGLSPATGP
ncbi:MAG: TlpA family protein disulfide reductase [Sedimentisphaerales bacterium]|nr:TlpA family protein disulfide reductase [Sedimentisphaerales bacterium]